MYGTLFPTPMPYTPPIPYRRSVPAAPYTPDSPHKNIISGCNDAVDHRPANLLRFRFRIPRVRLLSFG